MTPRRRKYLACAVAAACLGSLALADRYDWVVAPNLLSPPARRLDDFVISGRAPVCMLEVASGRVACQFLSDQQCKLSGGLYPPETYCVPNPLP